MTTQTTRKRNVVLAAVTGAALLLGGSAYALWTTTGQVDGNQTITAGSMSIDGGAWNAWDVSADRDPGSLDAVTRADSTEPSISDIELMIGEASIQGKKIPALDAWRMVPGDTVALTFSYLITLEGNNLAAQLTVPGKTALTADSNLATTNTTLEYQVFGDDGKALGTSGPQPLTDTIDPIATFTVENSNTKIQDAITVGDGGKAVVSLVIYVTFDDVGTDVSMGGTLMTLANGVKATLTQVR